MPAQCTPSFKGSFDHYHSLALKQIDLCPDELWNARVGGFPFWLQALHGLAATELFALPQLAAPSEQTRYSRGVIMFTEETTDITTKDELRAFAELMRKTAHAFMDGVTDESLYAPHERLTAVFGRPCTNFDALVGLVHHFAYHVGCLDSCLREKGRPGAF